MQYKSVNCAISDLRCGLSNGEKCVTLKLDHLNDEIVDESFNLRELHSKQRRFYEHTGTKILLNIDNAVSKEEQDLFHFCKGKMKTKNFQAIVDRATELLKDHPSSPWAHFFYGVACKKIPGHEKFVVPALTHAVSINPNFLSGWQALHKHFLGLGGFFSKDAHEIMCVVVRALLRLEFNYNSWCNLVGQIWEYVIAQDFNDGGVLSLLSPFLSCYCQLRQGTSAMCFINFILTKKKLLPRSFSSIMLQSFQIIIRKKESKTYRLGVFFAAIRYFNRTNDSKQICELLNFIFVNDLLNWTSITSKEFAYHLIYEMFNALGEDALETVFILKNACKDTKYRYFICDEILKLTSSYSNLIESYHTRRGGETVWGRLLYINVLTHLKLYQEAYEQILVDLSGGEKNYTIEKDYMKILINIFAHAKDPDLQRFSLRLGHKFLKLFGKDTKVLHDLCFVNISLGDHDTAREILKCLVYLGAFDDVIYLVSLLEKEGVTKLDYLKALDNVPNAQLLSAVIYKDLGKSKRVVKSMLETSFYYHCGITPFEWLGVYYYERDLVLKSSRYFLEAFSNYLVSCISVNYIVSIYSQHSDLFKLRAFFDTLSSRKAITMDVACNANLKAGLNFLTKANEPMDFHRALEKFRKVTDFAFERKTIEMVADSLEYFGMHGSASDFYLMCHADNGKFHVYPSVLYGTATKMVVRRGYKYLSTTRSVAVKAVKSSLALYTYSSAILDRALASYSVNNFRHCIFLCQQAVLILSRCIAIYSDSATFWISLGNVLFTVSSLGSDCGAVFVPSWLYYQKDASQSMVLVKSHQALILAFRCYSVALKACKSEEILKLIYFYLSITFRYAKALFTDNSDRLLYWALGFALDSCDFQCWQRNNLCGVILTGLSEFVEALDFFKDAMLVGANEDARDAEFNLGIVYLRLGEFMDAHEVFMYRRGGDPKDSLVWRSYIILHHCLDDQDTVFHYLWFLIYSIKHYPSLEQGMEYLRLLCESTSLSHSDNTDHLKKLCLMYMIFNSPMFMEISFVGNCSVSHKFNAVTALNYYYHGEYQFALGHYSSAIEDFHYFLKLVAENGLPDRALVDHSLLRLAMASDDNLTSLHDLSSEENNSEIAVLKLPSKYISCNKFPTFNQLSDGLNFVNEDCDATMSNFVPLFHNSDLSKLSLSTRKWYAEYISRSVLRLLLQLPSSQNRFPSQVFNEDILHNVVPKMFDVIQSDETSTWFVNINTISSLIENELKAYEL